MTIHETMLSTFAEICAELAVRDNYTGAAVMSLTEQVCWENLFHEICDRAEPVYAFDANGLLSAALKYRGRKLFDSNATLLWREPTHSEEDDELDTTRYLEMWMLEDMTLAVTSCFQVDYKDNSVPNCQQHCCAPRSNGSGHILPKERDHSFGHCISCQPNGAADVRSVDSRRTTRHLSFLQIHLIPAPASSWHRGFSYKGGNSWQPHGSCPYTLARDVLPEPQSPQLSTM